MSDDRYNQKNRWTKSWVKKGVEWTAAAERAEDDIKRIQEEEMRPKKPHEYLFNDISCII